MGATESLMEETVGYDNVHPLNHEHYNNNDEHQGKRGEYMEIGIGEEEKVWSLRGFVCGDEGVGRKTLIRKLRGEITSTTVVTDPQKQQQQQQVEQRRKRWMALVSWRPNVQLHVVLPPSTDAIAKTISTNNHRPCQFVLLLMDPRKLSSWEYTKNILSLLISNHNDKDTNRNNSRIENIAILLNFHDLKQSNSSKVDNNDDNDEEEEVILTRDEVAKYIQEQQIPGNENIRIQIYNISLHNGYGWKHVFNNFFHTVFFHTQEQFYQNKLQSIQSSLQSIHTLLPSQVNNTTRIHNNLPNNTSQETTPRSRAKQTLSSSKPTKEHENEGDQKEQVVFTKNEDIVENHHKPKSNDNNSNGSYSKESTDTTSTTNGKKKSRYEPKEAKKITLKKSATQMRPPKFKNPEDALEAFLASSSDSSDDDNDDKQVIPRHKQSFRNRTKRLQTKKSSRNPQIFQSSSSSSSSSSSEEQEVQIYQQVYNSNDTNSSSEDEPVAALPKDITSSKTQVASINNQSNKIPPKNETTVSNEVGQKQLGEKSLVKQNKNGNNKTKKSDDTEDKHAKEEFNTKNLVAANKVTDAKVNIETSDEESTDKEQPSQEKSNDSRLTDKVTTKDTNTSPIVNAKEVTGGLKETDDNSEEDDDDDYMIDPEQIPLDSSSEKEEATPANDNGHHNGDNLKPKYTKETRYSDQPHDNENAGKEETSEVVKSEVIQSKEKEGQSSVKEPGTLSEAARKVIASLEEDMKRQQNEEKEEETLVKKKKKKKTTRGEEGGKKKKKSKKKQEDGDVDERKERKRKKKKKPTPTVPTES